MKYATIDESNTVVSVFQSSMEIASLGVPVKGRIYIGPVSDEVQEGWKYINGVCSAPR